MSGFFEHGTDQPTWDMFHYQILYQYTKLHDDVMEYNTSGGVHSFINHVYPIHTNYTLCIKYKNDSNEIIKKLKSITILEIMFYQNDNNFIIIIPNKIKLNFANQSALSIIVEIPNNSNADEIDDYYKYEGRDVSYSLDATCDDSTRSPQYKDDDYKKNDKPFRQTVPVLDKRKLSRSLFFQNLMKSTENPFSVGGRKRRKKRTTMKKRNIRRRKSVRRRRR